MNVQIAPGKYVVAVSGGVDSMTLLDLLAGDEGFELELVVAHFDHGIREDSMEDYRLVQAAADRYGLPFVAEHGHLGAEASEARAREARYAFLRRVRAEQGARAIITAHHQDDVLETAILNGLRGTGPRGLSSLRSGDELVRPLLHISKQELLAYARARNLPWREDSTNQDLRYRRNYVRHVLVPRLSPVQRADLLQRVAVAAELNQDISRLVGGLLAGQQSPDTIDRAWFIQLPHRVAAEVMAGWLRAHNIAFDRVTIERLVVFIKTARAGRQADLDATKVLRALTDTVTLALRTVVYNA